MDTDKTMHFYLRTPERRPIGVVAIRKEAENNLRVALSLCHPNDQWNARLTSTRPGRSQICYVGKHKPLIMNVALELKPHGTAVKDLSEGIDWKIAQGIFERAIEHLMKPAEQPT